jgi:hypothetical protein
MNLLLKELSDELSLIGLHHEAAIVKKIIKKALEPKPKQELKVFQDPQYKKQMLNVLQTVGFKPLQENIIQLSHSIDFLKEGVTQNNLLLCGLNLITMIPGLENTKPLINKSKIESDINSTLSLARIIQKNQATIQGILNRIKQPNVINILKHYNLNLIVNYIDRILSTIRDWSFKIITTNQTQIDTEEQINKI